MIASPTSMPGSGQISIRVVSDVICPWCYIGKRRLEKALARLDKSTLTGVVWAPFELNPTMPASGIDRKTYRSTKFGTWSRSLELDAQVAAVGRSEGINFDFAKIQRTPNTFAAHRLIWFAQQRGLQNEIVEALFRAYFIEGRDIGEGEELTAIAASSGIHSVVARDFLESDEGAIEVAAEARRAREQDISGVPTFIVNDTSAISGALDPDTLVSLILRQRK